MKMERIHVAGLDMIVILAERIGNASVPALQIDLNDYSSVLQRAKGMVMKVPSEQFACTDLNQAKAQSS